MQRHLVERFGVGRSPVRPGGFGERGVEVEIFDPREVARAHIERFPLGREGGQIGAAVLNRHLGRVKAKDGGAVQKFPLAGKLRRELGRIFVAVHGAEIEKIFREGGLFLLGVANDPPAPGANRLPGGVHAPPQRGEHPRPRDPDLSSFHTVHPVRKG